MSEIDISLCVLCFERVLGCAERAECDANRYCSGHYLLRAQQQGHLAVEGGLFGDLGAISDEDQFVRIVNQAVSAGLAQPFSVRTPLCRIPRIK